MLKSRKMILLVMALGMLLGGVLSPSGIMAAPSGIMLFQNTNGNLRVQMETPSRITGNTFTVRPIVARLSSTSYNAVRSRIRYNVITVNAQGRSVDNIRYRPWNQRNSPTRNTNYRGHPESVTLRQGFVEAQVERRTHAVTLFGNQVRVRRVFQ